jgi:cobalt ECF transporter T component CbiQ
LFRKTILNIDEFLEHSLFEEKNVYRNGLMQKVSPEEKLVLTFLIIATTLVEEKPLSISLFFVLSLILSFLSKVDFLEFLKRTFIFIPLYALVISFPRLFLGNQKDIVIRFFNLELGTSFASVNQFLTFNFRVVVATSLVVLITMTTTIGELSNTLKKIRLPREISISLLLTYRLLFVYLTKIRDLALSIESRVAEGRVGLKETGRLVSNLLLRGFEESELVFLALESRNFEEVSILRRDEKKYNLVFFLLTIIFLALSVELEILS